ncbi:MAG: enoyl-CoA hydratase/isomerase family protein [Thermoanaerobaculia bacterium]
MSGEPARFELAPVRLSPGLVELLFMPSDARGVLDAEALTSLKSTVSMVASDPSVRLVALHGARPDLFAAGADLNDIARLTPESAGAFAEQGREAFGAWEALEATTVAVVRGACRGGAVDLILASDVVLAFPNATFAHPGVARGIVTGWGGTVRAARRLSPAALRALFTEEEPLSVERAVANGLVDLEVESDEMLSELLAAWSGPNGEPLRRLKQVARSVEGLTLKQALFVEERSRQLEES